MSSTPDLVSLLESVGNHDQVAFRELYNYISPRIYGLMRRILVHDDLANDALQEYFVLLWNSAERYDPSRGSPLAWLMTIARYQAFDVLRAQRALNRHLDYRDDIDMADELENPERNAIQRQAFFQIGYCLESLRPEQRYCVVLAYYHGYSHVELARKFDAPLGTVKTWVRRGLEQLRICMDK